MNRPKLHKLHIAIHSTVILGGWVLYIYALNFLLHAPPKAYKSLIMILILKGIFFSCLALWWALPHLGVQKKLKRNQPIVKASWNYKKDWLGYNVKGDFNALKKEQVVTIICNEKKKYKLFCLESEIDD